MSDDNFIHKTTMGSTFDIRDNILYQTIQQMLSIREIQIENVRPMTKGLALNFNIIGIIPTRQTGATATVTQMIDPDNDIIICPSLTDVREMELRIQNIKNITCKLKYLILKNIGCNRVEISGKIHSALFSSGKKYNRVYISGGSYLYMNESHRISTIIDIMLDYDPNMVFIIL